MTMSFSYHSDCLEHERLLCRENGIGKRSDNEWIHLHEHVSEGGMGVLEGSSPEVMARFCKDND